MKTKILRNIFISVGVLFALARLLSAGTNHGALNFGNMPLAGHSPTYTTFDAPGAGTGPNQGTLPLAIDPAGAITGYYVDASGVNHGFLRTTKGTITTIDVPGAGAFGTQVYSISPSETITGVYGQGGVIHGFLRDRSGAITTFDAPSAVHETVPSDINPGGAVAGWYNDANFVMHGFLRTADGTFTTYDAPGAGTGMFQGTFIGTVDCLNPAGTIAGVYLDASNVYHGYVRASDGTITDFDVPGAGTGPFQGSYPVGINQRGTIEGEYIDASNVGHGFVREANGAITTFDVPGAGTGPGQGTLPANINAPGDITGWYIDASSVAHGFSLAKHGTLTTFDVPGAGTGSGQGSFPYCNNPVDAMTGYYIDSSGVFHRFLRTP